MRKSSIILLTTLALLVLGVLIPVQAQNKVTITLSTWAGVNEAAELQKILDKINSENTDFEVVHQPIPSDYLTQVKTQIAGGNAADLYWIGNEDLALAAEGVFLPLTDCVKDAAPKTAGDVNE